MSEKKEKELSFEEQMASLEEIVKTMESSEVPLEKMMELFEKGTALVRSCSEILKNAEQKVVLLTQNKDGEWNESDFNGAE